MNRRGNFPYRDVTTLWYNVVTIFYKQGDQHEPGKREHS